jgi:hypothetical protein
MKTASTLEALPGIESEQSTQKVNEALSTDSHAMLITPASRSGIVLNGINSTVGLQPPWSVSFLTRGFLHRRGALKTFNLRVL